MIKYTKIFYMKNNDFYLYKMGIPVFSVADKIDLDGISQKWDY